MKYSRFELVIMVVGVVVVVGTVFAAISSSNVASNVVGQLLILVVLFGGLHYGRKGALAGFLIATAVNAAVTFGTMSGATNVALQLFIYRTLVYAFVGVVAGELINVRLKYFFMRLEHHEYVDSLTSLFNQRYLSMLIERYAGESDRYGSTFSLTTLVIRPDMFASLKDKLRRKIIKDLGNSVIRGNIRGPDEAARIEDSKFAVIYPNTSYDGAIAATVRVKSKINNYLDRSGLATEHLDTVATEVWEYPRDRDALREMVVQLSSNPQPERKGPPSG